MLSSADIGLAVVFLALIDGMNQRQLALRAGVSDKTISAWRNGTRAPSRRAMKKVLQVLGRSLDEVESFAADIAKRRDPKRQAATMEVIGNDSDDERLREIGRAVRRLFSLLLELPGPTKP